MTPLTAIPLAAVATDHDSRNHRSEALAALHTRTVDSLAGYETMVEKAEPEFRAVAESFRALHARHATALANLLAKSGYDVGNGSLMGAVNRTVVSMRALFDEIDADVMTAIRNGEAHVLDAFDLALREPFEADQIATISAMRDELVALLDRSPAAA